MAYTIYMFIYCAVGFLGGILAEKLQPRVAIYIGLVLFAGGWILTGFASSIPFLYIAYGVIAGAGAGTIYPACLPTALNGSLIKWFYLWFSSSWSCLWTFHYVTYRSNVN